MSGLDAIRVVLGVLIVIDVAIWFVLPSETAIVGSFHLPLVALAAMIGAAEVAAIHLDIGRDRHTISMSDLPYTLGMFLVLPHELLLAQLVGLGLELALVRRQTPLKLAFNLAQSWAATGTGVLVFRMIVPDGATALTPITWVAAVVAALLTASTSGIIVSHVIALMDGRVGLENLRESVTSAALGSLGNASIGLLVVALLAVKTIALSLLILPVAALFAAYRVYEHQRTANRSLSFLYQVSQSLAGDTEVDTSLAELTETVRERMNVRVAVVVVAPAGDSGATGLVVTAVDEEAPQVAHRSLTTLELSAVTALGKSGPVMLASANEDPTTFPRALLDELAVPDDAIAIALQGPARPLGFILVADRLGDLDTLTTGDEALLAAVANQLSTSLTAARLESSLSELHRLQETLRHRAEHDALTGLCNRVRFTSEVDEELGRATGSTAVLFLDLDDFKTINDSMGHHVGDELLQAVARRLEGAIKSTDLVARLGGDEFAVLLRNVTFDRAEKVANRLASVLTDPFELEAGPVNVGTSVGIAHHDGSEPITTSELLRNADTAMYAAKRDSSTHTRAFEQSMHEQASQRLLLRNDLQRALVADEFIIYLQPLVDLETDRVLGAEALIRWDHPDRGVLAPGVFLDLAEESGMMQELGRRVLEKSCQAAVHWPADTRISVNLSRSQLLSDNQIVDEVRTVLEETGLDPARLLLEITEFAVMSHVERSIVVLTELVQLGVKIALDDFGTGYSSLQHLARLPVHVLKIAKPFIDALDGRENAEQTALVARGIIELGHALGLDTVAEGIELPQQVDVLNLWGAQIGQGYLLGRPGPVADFVLMPQEAPATRTAPGGGAVAAGTDTPTVTDDAPTTDVDLDGRAGSAASVTA